MNSVLTRKLKDLRKQFPGACHRYGLVMMRLLARHCEFLATQRIRRTSQVVTLYSKLWNESAIEKMMERLRHQAGARGKMLLLGAAILKAHGQYDWSKERVSNYELDTLFAEFDETRSLLDAGEICRVCGERRIFDKAVSWGTYCNCRHKGKSVRVNAPHGWEAFLERSDVVIWRRPIGGRNFEYRVFGKYNDVCAGAWFRINADDKKRKDWDDTCLEIREIDEDPESRTQVLYWRSQYPFPMSNRDYVFKKNFVLDRKRHMALIFNHDTVHPLVPETKDHVRIKRYKSIIVVRPHTDFHQEGMDFSISYMDDPGVELPEIFISYVTVQGFPNYVDKMRNAAKKLEKALGREVMSVENLMAYFGLREEKEDVYSSPPEDTDGPNMNLGSEPDAYSPASSPIARIFVDRNLRNPESDVQKAAKLLRELLGFKEKRPDSVENVVVTVSPALLRRSSPRKDSHNVDSSSSAVFSEVTESETIESYRESEAESGSVGSYLTYWIPLSWLKRVVDVLPVYSSSMQSSERREK